MVKNPIFSADAYRNDTIQQFPSDCNVLTLKLSTQAFSFCLKSKTLRYSYEVDLNNNGTIDLKGSLPYVFIKKSDGLKFGTHKIYWTVKDVCGNSSKLSKLFTVVDAKKPTIVTKILDYQIQIAI
ncbi:MAG: hypothetical protein IPL95_19790 [Saprospiraceae bacterium]|nr:hypothetical protein [Saprospiraceae bacterium]